MKFVFTTTEIKEIIIAAIVLSVAFAFAIPGGIMKVDWASFPIEIIYAFFAVGIGFLAHELIGHKIVAQHLGMHGEFRAWRLGLGIALLSSLAGVVFAAPGAVYVSPKVDIWGRPDYVSKKKIGIVSAMGPVINLLLAGTFIGISYFYPADFFSYAIFINLWLAFINMLPIPPLDGLKVLMWDKRIWFALFAALSILVFL